MDFLGAFGVVLGVGLALLVVLFARRLLIARGGTVEVSVRLYRGRRGRGWALGMARFAGDELRWYRLFSFAARPRRILNRKQLSILGRRDPDGTERLALLSGSVVVECATKDGPIELAMGMGAFTGFLSWLEAAGGRAGYPPYAA